MQVLTNNGYKSEMFKNISNCAISGNGNKILFAVNNKPLKGTSPISPKDGSWDILSSDNERFGSYTNVINILLSNNGENTAFEIKDKNDKFEIIINNNLKFGDYCFGLEHIKASSGKEYFCWFSLEDQNLYAYRYEI